MDAHVNSDLRWAWFAALGVFILAASTGALYRFGMLLGLPPLAVIGMLWQARRYRERTLRREYAI